MDAELAGHSIHPQLQEQQVRHAMAGATFCRSRSRVTCSLRIANILTVMVSP